MAGGKVRDSKSKRRELDEIAPMISALPDELVTHILSCLPTTEEVVRICILSKRWKFAWTSVFNLYFIQGRKTPNSSFAKYVDRVLSLNNAFPLKNFRLDCVMSDTRNPFPICSWINAAISRNVHCLDISILNFFTKILLPDCLFACERLEVLKLSGSFTLQVPDSVSLSNLKILSLNNIKFRDGNSLTKLLSSCPLLEELSLTWPFIYAQNFCICSPSLKSLKIHYIRIIGYPSEDIGTVVDAPKLTYIYLSNAGCVNGPKYIRMRNTPSLVTASIWFPYISGDLEKMFFDLLENLSNIESLKLGPVSIEPPQGHDHQKLLSFQNLKHLEVEMNFDFCFLVYLLKQSPNLISLTLSRLKGGIWGSLDSSYLCLHLEQVMIKDFMGKKQEMEIIRYLLMKGPVLKKMTLCSTKLFAKRSPKDADVLKELSMLPRASTACQFAISYEF